MSKTPMERLKLNIADPAPSTRHVYLQLVVADSPTTPSTLERWTGYSYETVRSAIRTLQEAGVVETADPSTDGREAPYQPVYHR